MATLSNDSARIPSKDGGMTRFESLYRTILFYGTIKLEFLNYEALCLFLFEILSLVCGVRSVFAF